MRSAISSLSLMCPTEITRTPNSKLPNPERRTSPQLKSFGHHGRSGGAFSTPAHEHYTPHVKAEVINNEEYLNNKNSSD